MSKAFIVNIDERLTHSLVIEAETSEEALERGYDLLRDGMTPEDEEEYDYSFESDGFTGQHSTWEE